MKKYKSLKPITAEIEGKTKMPKMPALAYENSKDLTPVIPEEHGFGKRFRGIRKILKLK